MPSVFLSHSSKDKSFVRKLAERLRSCGVRVWLDEAEIRIGDSLIARIGEAIDECDFCAVVLSPSSVESEWVQRELRLALNKEFASRKVVVLPLLLEHTAIPLFLRDKKYADFTALGQFEEAFRLLLERLGVQQVAPAVPGGGQEHVTSAYSTEAATDPEQIDVQHVLKQLLKGPGVTRRATARRLQKVNKRQLGEVLGELIDALDDEEMVVRRAATNALGDIGSDAAVGAIVHRLKDEDKRVQVKAAWALRKCAQDALVAVPALITALQDEDRDVRRHVVGALLSVGDDRAVPALVAALSDTAQKVRRPAAVTLGRMGDGRAVPALIDALKDKAQKVRRAAAVALGRIGAPEAVAALQERVEDSAEHERVRIAAQAAIRRIQE